MSRRRPRVPGTPRLTVVLDGPVYIAPRVGYVAANGRAVQLARCGHDVYVGARGLDAIGRRGKRLVCGPCRAAFAAEHGARLSVWWVDDDAGREAAA